MVVSTVELTVASKEFQKVEPKAVLMVVNWARMLVEPTVASWVSLMVVQKADSKDAWMVDWLVLTSVDWWVDKMVVKTVSSKVESWVQMLVDLMVVLLVEMTGNSSVVKTVAWKAALMADYLAQKLAG
jgi:hypothetical protein